MREHRNLMPTLHLVLFRFPAKMSKIIICIIYIHICSSSIENPRVSPADVTIETVSSVSTILVPSYNLMALSWTSLLVISRLSVGFTTL